MKRNLTALLLLLAVSAGVSAQTATEIENRLGAPTKAYTVNESVWMTPEFAADGQVCRMRFYPRHVAGTTNVISKDLALEKFRTAIEQMVPMSARGARKNIPEDVAWATGGGLIWAIFTFEHVRITYVDSFELAPGGPSSFVRGEFTFTETAVPTEAELAAAAAKPRPSESEFKESRVVMAYVEWPDRKCAGE